MTKFLLLTATLLVSSFATAGDYSELESPLMTRVESGCAKYAKKKADEAVANYFNINSWAGGNIGAGSVMTAEQNSKIYEDFVRVQCQNMVIEVLEMKLGWGPWQVN